MALDVGELVGKLKVDDKGMDKGLKAGESKFKDFSNKLTKLAAAGGLAAAAAFGGAILANLNQDAIGAKISAQLGGTAADAKNYGRIAGELYAENWGESVQAIGDTLKIVAQAHILPDGTPEELEDVTRRAQILADVFGQDVQGSVRAVSQLIRTGLVKNAQEGFDLIAAGIQGGLDKSGDLLDTLNEYPTEFRNLGLSGAQALGLIQEGLQAGARDSDIVADALKEFSLRSKDLSATSMDAYKSLGLNGKAMSTVFAKGGPAAAAGLQQVIVKLKAIKDPVERNRIAVELFGTQAEDLGGALYALDLDKATQQFSNVAGAIQKAGDAAGNTDAAKLEKFKRQAMAAAQSLAADLVPSLSAMGGWLKDNAGWVKPLAEGLGLLATTIVAVNLAQKAWTATQAAWTAVTEGAAAVQWLFNAALWASPITWIVLAIVALVAIIVIIATKTDWFQRLWGWAWGGIKKAAMATWSWISGTLWPGMKMVFSAIGAAALWVWHYAIEPAFNGIVAVTQFALRIITSIGALIAWAWLNLVGKPIMWAWQNLIWPALQAIGTAAMWLWTNVLSPTLSAISTAITWTGNAFRWLWQNAILPAVQGIAAAANWLWQNAIRPTFNFISSAVTITGDVIRTVFGKVAGWISSAFSGAAGIVRGAMNGVISAINGAISGINWVISKANSIPGVDFPSIPSIPHLASGGVVNPRPGGTPVVMGDGGQVEYGVPKSDMEQIIAQAVRAGGGHAEISVQVELVGDGVLKIVRTKVNREGLRTLEQTP